MTWDECRKIRRKTGIVFIFFILLDRVASLSIDSSVRDDAVVLLAKTKQTFKLGDLQYLEATVQSESNYECKRLLMDAATGSSLFVLDRFTADFENYIFGKENCKSRYGNGLPSSLLSCEWVGEVLFESPSPEELLNDLSTKMQRYQLEAWTLEYLRMTSALTTKPQSERTYTQKTLCCCVSQKLSGMAALNPHQAVDKLLLVDTSESVLLVKLLQLPSGEASSVPSPSPIRLTPQKWAQRPFPYSAATNFEAAKMVINLLAHRAASRSEQAPHLLDATCGSGTFLALAMARGMQVTGWDSNPRCVEGTERNLHYAFGGVKSFTVLHRNCLDVPEDMKQAGVEKVDAVACNLPWGLNTNIYADDGNSDNCSSHLLSAIRNVLKPGIPCAFLYKDENESAQDDLYWEQLGYKVIGHANIPQKNFVLPKEGKKEKKRTENVWWKRSSFFGDGAYVNASPLATPFRNPASKYGERCNFFHSELRIRVECALGMLVKRWGILRTALPKGIKLHKSIRLVLTLTRLHNFCLDLGNCVPPPTSKDHLNMRCSERGCVRMEGAPREYASAGESLPPLSKRLLGGGDYDYESPHMEDLLESVQGDREKENPPRDILLREAIQSGLRRPKPRPENS